MFNNGILMEVSGLKERTFYRYLKTLRNQGILSKRRQFYYDEKEARKIAQEIGFMAQLEKYIKEKIDPEKKTEA